MNIRHQALNLISCEIIAIIALERVNRKIGPFVFYSLVHIWKPAPHGSHLDASLGPIVICRTEETNSRYTQDIQSLTWSPDARTVLAGRRDSSVVEWDTVTGSCLRIVRRNT